MADLTERPVCFEEYKDPKLLPCNHTLCRKCLESLQKRKHIICPMCNSKHQVPENGVEAFTDNPHVIQLIAHRKEMTAMKELMEAKLKKKQKENGAEDQANEVAGAMAECSLQGDQDQGAAACDTSTKRQERSENANLLTFTRQKLALMQSEYDPKCCSQCGKTSSASLSGELKLCAKCKTAKYCSRDCQSKDWQAKHKIHCKEIARLKATIESEEANMVQLGAQGGGSLEATMDGRPWLIDRNIEYYNMCVHEDKLFPMGFNVKTRNRVISMYNATTGMKGGVICRLAAIETVVGVCAVEAGDLCYLVVTHAEDEFSVWKMDFWSYPQLKTKPVYTFRAKPYTIGVVHFADGNLLVVHPLKQIVEEFDVSSFPVKRTGFTIPTGLVPWQNQIRNMCAIKHGGEKRLLLHYAIEEIDSGLRCVDYRGQQLWEIKQQPLGGLPFHPEDVCSDNNGHVFTLDSRGNRVVVINPDRSLEVLITTPGVASSLARCDVTGRLYVAHHNEGSDFQAMVSRYNVTEQ